MKKNNNWLVSAMVSPISFIDEGVESVISTLKKEGVNSLFVIPHGYNPELIERVDYDTGHGLSGKHGHPGGTFVTTHPEYYGGISTGDTRALGEPFGDFDVLESVIPEARSQGMSVHVFNLEAASTGGRELNVPGFPRMLETDIVGRRASLPCINNPEYRAWQLALVEDIYKSYPIDGFTWGMERWGPLHQVLVGEDTGCFCSHCQSVMRENGLNASRVIEGYRTLWDSVNKWNSEERGDESPMIELFKIISRYPEIISWERLWTERYMDMHKELYGVAKWIAPERPFGICLWHYYFTNPLLRSEWDLKEIANYADSISAYQLHFPEAARIDNFLSWLRSGPMKDFDSSELFNAFSKILDIDLGTYENAVTKGISEGLPPEFVGQGVEIMRQHVGPSMPIYPLIGIDVVQEGVQNVMEPKDVQDAIESAAKAGADGIHMARNYAEMRINNIKSVGEILKKLGKI